MKINFFQVALITTSMSFYEILSFRACIYLWYQPGLNPVTHGEIFLVLHYIPAWVRKATNCLLLLKFLCIYKKKNCLYPLWNKISMSSAS